ncbi:MAG: serine/threonine protein kinase, partial [Planctomycetota bacterium]
MNLDRLVGTTVGDYTLKRLLGQGGMGAVFLGWHVHMQLPYAVKVLRPDMTGESFLERFFLEARLGAQLKHENIVGMHYAGVAQLDGSTMPYLAMEYVEGESVRTAVKQAGGKLSPLASANVMSQALRGLGYAHRQKMIHRDIKPDNLMINRAGVVKIADFGLARSVGGESGLTLSGQVLGTPAYMSLEQWRSDKDIDGRTDIYSLGATWYHILAGKPPYAGDPYTILARLNAGPPPPIVESNPGCDEELGGIVMRMMAQHADNRYATAEEVLRAIDTWSRNVASPEEVEESLVLLVPDESRVLPMGEPPTDTLRPRQSGFVTPRPATARANASSTAQGTLLEIGGTPMPTAAASGRRSSRRTGVTDPDVYPPTPPDEAGAHARRGGHGMLIGVLVAIVIGLVGAFVAIALTPKPDGGNRNEPVADGRNTDANTATPGTNNTTDVGNAANTNAGTNSGPTPVDPPGETAAAAALRMALEANTPSVLRSFLADHGSSPEAAQARQRLDELDEAAATAAGAADTADARTRYLKDLPDGRHH